MTRGSVYLLTCIKRFREPPSRSLHGSSRVSVKSRRGAGLLMQISDSGIAGCASPALPGNYQDAATPDTSASTTITINIAIRILRSLASCSACIRSHSSHLVTALLPIAPCNIECNWTGRQGIWLAVISRISLRFSTTRRGFRPSPVHPWTTPAACRQTGPSSRSRFFETAQNSCRRPGARPTSRR